ncbi:hypothetical protein GXW82_42880 [Streptacidiphilus sp. 4-A2]|nr:hypothetical protein [Streptacidiphilus sp. 4-A2]
MQGRHRRPRDYRHQRPSRTGRDPVRLLAGGCLGSTETRTGSVAVRVDDLADWVKQNTAATLDKWKLQLLTTTDQGLFHAIRDSNGDWGAFATSSGQPVPSGRQGHR